jgi:hypothetical protein
MPAQPHQRSLRFHSQQGSRERCSTSSLFLGYLEENPCKVRTHLHPRRETRHDGEGFESRGSAMGALDRKSNPRRVNPPEPSLWETASGHTKAHSQGALTPPLVTPRLTLRVHSPRATHPLTPPSRSLLPHSYTHRRVHGGMVAAATRPLRVTILIPNILSPSTRAQQERRTVLVHGTRLGASPSDRNWGRVDEQQG